MISDCHPEQLITDSKYLTSSALSELMSSIIHASQQIASAQSGRDHSDAGSAGTSSDESSSTHTDRLRLSIQREDSVIFLLELMISIVLENRDRLIQLWPEVKSHLHFLLSSFDHNPLISERATIGLLRVASKNLFRLNDDPKIAEEILQSLVLLLVSKLILSKKNYFLLFSNFGPRRLKKSVYEPFSWFQKFSFIILCKLFFFC